MIGIPPALLTMKAKKVTYWIATILLAGFMAFAAFSYLTREQKVISGFASLGYPAYFPTILGVAKMLGVLALLAPGLPRLKEWAYAGFTFTFIGAICSHLASDQNKAALMPLASLVVLAISYACRPAERRVAAESEAEVHHHLSGGMAAR
jgi:p-aminobenzoyl-glutamate transporter AbgT